MAETSRIISTVSMLFFDEFLHFSRILPNLNGVASVTPLEAVVVQRRSAGQTGALNQRRQ